MMRALLSGVGRSSSRCGIARPQIASRGSSLKLPRSSPAVVPPTHQPRSFHSGLRLASEGGPLNLHLDTEWNNPDTPFDFCPELYAEIDTILAKYPTNRRQSGILPLLHLAQRQMGGWVPLAAMNKIAHILDVPPLKVYECATFYSMFNREPVGKYHIQVCTTTPCMVSGSDEILEALESHLGIHLNETTADGMITLGTMECMGCCVNAPMFVLSDYSDPPKFSYDFYEDLTVKKAIEIVDKLRKGEKPPHGPQNGRFNAMGIQGKTTLLQPPRGPYCRDLSK